MADGSGIEWTDATWRSLGVDHPRAYLRHQAENVPVLPDGVAAGTGNVAVELGTTRSAAALHLWGSDLDGAVVAIGNAPTALFELLELIDAGGPRPAAVVGAPVGFVGAAESCEALAARTDLEFLTVLGRRGGSAITAAAINALATPSER